MPFASQRLAGNGLEVSLRSLVSISYVSTIVKAYLRGHLRSIQPLTDRCPAEDIGPVVLQDIVGALPLGGFMSRLLCIGLGHELPCLALPQYLPPL